MQQGVGAAEMQGGCAPASQSGLAAERDEGVGIRTPDAHGLTAASPPFPTLSRSIGRLPSTHRTTEPSISRPRAPPTVAHATGAFAAEIKARTRGLRLTRCTSARPFFRTVT